MVIFASSISHRMFINIQHFSYLLSLVFSKYFNDDQNYFCFQFFKSLSAVFTRQQNSQIANQNKCIKLQRKLYKMRLLKSIVVALLLLAQIQALGRFTTQFRTTATPTTDDDNLGTYPFGFVTSGSELIFRITINSATTDKSNFAVKMASTSNNAGTTVPLVVTSDISILQGKYTAVASQHHKLRTTLSDPLNNTFVRIYSISGFVKVGTVTPIITPIFQNYVNILRYRIYKYIYNSEIRSLIISMHYSTGLNSAPDLVQRITMDSTNTTNLKSLTGLSNLSSSFIGNTRNYQANFTKGFFLLKFRAGVADNRTTVTYYSDPYPCPFPSTHTDIFHSFAGCYHSQPSQIVPFPCVTLTNGICTYCYYGYVLVGIICTYNPCNSDEYYLNLTCLKANPSCKEFDRFSGVCLTCLNSNYTLINGNCIVNACPSGHTNRNNTCVNNYCSNFILISGVCLSCINNAFELIDGSCAPVKCFAPNLYFSFNAQLCVSLPVYCNQLNFISQKCTACLSPFVLNATTSICEIICTLPQVKWLDQCVNLPQNCDQININRHCSKCKPNCELISGVCQSTGAVIINNP